MNTDSISCHNDPGVTSGRQLPRARVAGSPEINFVLSRPCLELLPIELQPAAKSFLTYLDTLPHSAPAACPTCASRSIYLSVPAGQGGRRRPGYICQNCNKHFTVLTGTPLHRLRAEDKWRGLMELRFAGLSVEAIASLLSISSKASLNWDKAFTASLESFDHELYQWWHGHQTLQLNDVNDSVKSELAVLLSNMDRMRRATTAECPHCGAASGRPYRSGRVPKFICDDCGVSYTALTNTSLAYLQNIDVWPAYLRLLVDGRQDTEIGVQLGFSSSLTAHWRRSFMAILKSEHPLLAHWAMWKWSRRRVTAQSHNTSPIATKSAAARCFFTPGPDHRADTC